MGKRKQHGITYYQCDWTGLPMRSTNCYMPTWNGDKLVKHGSYAYWECVVAHVHELEKAGDLLDVEARTSSVLAPTSTRSPLHRCCASTSPHRPAACGSTARS